MDASLDWVKRTPTIPKKENHHRIYGLLRGDNKWFDTQFYYHYGEIPYSSADGKQRFKEIYALLFNEWKKKKRKLKDETERDFHIRIWSLKESQYFYFFDEHNPDEETWWFDCPASKEQSDRFFKKS